MFYEGRVETGQVEIHFPSKRYKDCWHDVHWDGEHVVQLVGQLMH